MKRMKNLLLGLVVGIAIIGCSSLNNTAFRLENLAADTGKSTVSGFNEYYRASTNGASPETIAKLDQAKIQVYDASRKLSASLSVVESTRQAYATNGATKLDLQSVMAALSANQSNIVWLVNYIKGGTPPLPPSP